jgi:hypothetical protein
MSFKIGVSTLSFSMAWVWPSPTPYKLAKIARELGVGLQVVPLRGWSAMSMFSIRHELVLATEALFIKELIFRPWFNSEDFARYNYNVVSNSIFRHVPKISYMPDQNCYLHAVSEHCNGQWDGMLQLHHDGCVAGIVMDTCHSLTPRQGLSPVANDPCEFANQCRYLHFEGVPWILHLQPSRIPRGAKALVTSNLIELFAFIRGEKGNPLSTMVSPLRLKPDIPVIIEIDPKIGALFLLPGLKWLVKNTVKAILRDAR